MPAPSAHGFHRISTDELKRLFRALHRGVFVPVLTRQLLIEKGFGNIEGHLSHVIGKDPSVAMAAIVAVLQERGAWEYKWEKRTD